MGFLQAAAMYIFGGAAFTLMQQTASYYGASEPTTLLYLLPMYVGNMGVYLFPQPNKPRLAAIFSKLSLQIGLIALLDVVMITCAVLGIMFAGSGIAGVLQSSALVLAALLSFVFLGKKLQPLQWVSIAITFFGLGLSAMGGSLASKDELPNAEAQIRVMWGNVLSLICAVLAAIEGIVAEKLLKGDAPVKSTSSRPSSRGAVDAVSTRSQAQRSASPSAESLLTRSSPAQRKPALSSFELCVLLGFCGTVYVTLYLLAYTLPRWNALVTSKLTVAGPHALGLYLAMPLFAAVTGKGYFLVLEGSGAVVIGLVNAVRAVFLFGLSHYLYCGSDPAQCVGLVKLLAIAIILTGVLGFSLFQQPDKKDDDV